MKEMSHSRQKKLPFATKSFTLLLILIFLLVFSSITALVFSFMSYNHKKSLDLISKQKEMTFETYININKFREAITKGEEEKASEIGNLLVAENGLLDDYLDNIYLIFDGSDDEAIRSKEYETVFSNTSILVQDLEKFVKDTKEYINNPSEDIYQKISSEVNNISTNINMLSDIYYYKYHRDRVYQNFFSAIAIITTIIASAIAIKSFFKVEQLEYYAKYDKLTGLSNLLSLEEYSKTLNSKKYAVVFIDIDGFKKINQKYGSYIGNELIGALGKRINAIFKGHFCCRYGGDEFLVILEIENDFPINNYLIRLYEDFLAVYVDTNGSMHEVNASIGIIGCDVKKESLNTSIEWASLAVQVSKKSLTDKFCYIKNDEEKAIHNI